VLPDDDDDGDDLDDDHPKKKEDPNPGLFQRIPTTNEFADRI
jgi:hypothetical protein